MENNKINIAEILREYPPGMELDCTMYDNVRLKYVSVFTDEDYPICIETKSGFDTKLTKYGQNVKLDDAKCVIFPKGKTTWEGFVPYQFKDGDIIVGKDSNCSYIAIFESFKNNEDFNYHVILTNFGSFKITGVANNANLRFATEEEKQKLFDALKENGYYWDKRIKTVKALIISPKFKVGDRIIHKDSGIYCTLGEYSEGISAYRTSIGLMIKYKDLEQWELLPNKFDIGTLKPFDKVLVRHNTNEKWDIDLFSCIDNGKMFRTITGTYVQCIPYEGNEHLLDTDKDCNDYYKTWED